MLKGQLGKLYCELAAETRQAVFVSSSFHLTNLSINQEKLIGLTQVSAEPLVLLRSSPTQRLSPTDSMAEFW